MSRNDFGWSIDQNLHFGGGQRKSDGGWILDSHCFVPAKNDGRGMTPHKFKKFLEATGKIERRSTLALKAIMNAIGSCKLGHV
jgi:hypothetical protein